MAHGLHCNIFLCVFFLPIFARVNMNLRATHSSAGHSLILLGKDNTTYFWGRCGSERILSPRPLVLPEGHRNIKIISAASGVGHALVLTEHNHVFSCGKGDRGQLGVQCGGTDFDTWLHVPLPETEKITEVHCGGYFSAALTEDGSVWFWGTMHKETTRTPTKISSLPPVRLLSCAFESILALTQDGSIFGWGINSCAELGLLREETFFFFPTLSPLTEISEISEIAELAPGTTHFLACTKKGAVYTWGSTFCATNGTDKPTLVIPSGIRHVASGEEHALLLHSDGSVRGWGENEKNQVSSQNSSEVRTPEVIPELAGEKVEVIGAGFWFSWAITCRGKLFLWGSSEYGQMGTGSTENNFAPKILPDLEFQTPFFFHGWEKMFKWLFLGKKDSSAIFSCFPLEVIFNFISLFF